MSNPSRKSVFLLTIAGSVVGMWLLLRDNGTRNSSVLSNSMFSSISSAPKQLPATLPNNSPSSASLSEKECNALQTTDISARAIHQQHYDELKLRVHNDINEGMNESGEVQELSEHLKFDNIQVQHLSSSDKTPEALRSEALPLAIDAKSTVEKIHRISTKTTTLIDDAIAGIDDSIREGCIFGNPSESNQEMRLALITSKMQVQQAVQSADDFMPTINQTISLVGR